MAELTPHQSAALDYSSHISLTANAGSGKTFVLSKRYLEIVTRENLSLRNIAAITFTDKAASELYKKIALQLDERIAASKDKTEARKLENIRRQLVSANISTIHSFCTDILREYPVEAGLDANFSPIDESLSEELIELSVEEMIRKSIKDKDSEESLKYLIRLFASKGAFSKQIISLIKNRKNVLLIESRIYSGNEETIAAYFRDSFRKYAREILLKNKDRLLYAIKEINEAVLSDDDKNEKGITVGSLLTEIRPGLPEEKIISLLQEIRQAMLTKSGTIRLQGYLKKNKIDELSDTISLVEIELNGIAKIKLADDASGIELELAKFGKTILMLFRKALDLYEEKKKEGGYLDYEDILLHTQNILMNEAVRNSLSEKFRYIMIDEYQDTNEIQYQIFLPILDHLKKGNLFVVGDEKQSIYMFRDAELEVFDRTRREIESAAGPGHLLTLPDSFRMAPAICLFANTLFGRLFADPNPVFNEVASSDLVCARQDNSDGGIEILIAGGKNGGDEESSGEDEQNETDYGVAEAEMVASRIIKLVKEDNEQKEFSWSSIAVLCRKRKSFGELEKVFTKYNIPFAIMGGKGFYQRQTVYDVYNYFSFLSDDKNDTALVGILRSPFFALSDAEIFEISLLPGETYWQKLRQAGASNGKIAKAVKMIDENLVLAGGAGITELLRKIIRETNLPAVIAAKSNGKQELANIQKLVKVTINFVSQGFRTLYDYVTFLRESIEKTDDEAQAALPEDSDSVKIMTVHQSKGLEFPAVFLYRSAEYTRKDSVKSKSVYVDKNFGILTKVPTAGNYFSEYEEAPIVGINNLIAEKKNYAELKRLFYVAVTRAKDQLFISAEGKKSGRYSRESFMGMLIEGLGVDPLSAEYNLSGSLKFLKESEGGFTGEEKLLSIRIPVTKEIQSPEQSIEVIYSGRKKRLLLNEVHDLPKGEIISATKVSVYAQCPLKYRLTYEYGFSPLLESYKKWIAEKSAGRKANKKFEFSEAEEIRANGEDAGGERSPAAGYADVKGRVIHKLLQEEIQAEGVKDFTLNAVKEELGGAGFKTEDVEKLVEEIVSAVLKFYGSESFLWLKKFLEYRNEYEVYVSQSDYYLFGIIDKLILEGEKAFIIDYKTDNIEKDEIRDRADIYFTQLKFYSYIVSYLFKNIVKFELRIIFVTHPDELVRQEFGRDELIPFKAKLESMIAGIRNGIIGKNTEHCSKCFFALKNNRCIKE